MKRHAHGPLTVVGVGNLLHSDDGAGLRALRLLERDPGLPPGVELVDGSVLGMDVITVVQNASRLLFLDAVDVGTDPGTVVRMEGEEVKTLPGGTSAHDIGISGLISLLQFLGKTPERIALVGIQPASTGPGVRLSPGVESGLGRAVSECLRLLGEWSSPGGEKEPPGPSGTSKAKP